MAVQRAAAALGALAILAGLVVTIAKPAVVQATAPTPGIVTTFAGGSKTGYATSIAQFPSGLALSGTTLYISIGNQYLVRALDLTTGVETVYAGTGQPGSAGDGGPATSATLNAPAGLATDTGGDLFISTGDRVREVTPSGTISTIAGGGAGCTDPCAATSATLAFANGLSVDGAGNVYIADAADRKIRKVSAGTISTVAGGGVELGDGVLATDAYLDTPQAVYANSSGDLWIADTNHNLIRYVDHGTGIINTIAGGGLGSVCGNGAATSQQLYSPNSVWVGSSGQVLFAEPLTRCVQSLSGSTVTTVAGMNSGVSGFLAAPTSAISDASNNIYIADSGGYGVNPGVYKLSGSTLTRIAGNDGDNCSVYGLGGPAKNAMLCRPRDVKLDAAGNMYIADWMAAEILKVDVNGTLTRYAGTGVHGTAGEGGPATSAELSSPISLAINSTGDVYFVDGNAVRRVDHASGLISTVAGSVIDYGFAGDGGPATSARFFNPWGIGFDRSDNLYIADIGNYRVRRVTPVGTITTFAGNGGSCSDLGYSGPATGACLNSITGVASDSAGNIFIAHGGPIDRVDLSGYLTNYGSANNTIAIAVGPQDRIVATAGSQAVVFPPSGAGVVLAGASSSDNGFAGDGGPARSATFNDLYGIAIDGDGDLFLADMWNGRIRRVQAYTAPSAPSGVSAVAANRKATVNWSAPADDGGLPFVRYTVTPYTGATPRPSVAVTATTVQIGSLITGTDYTFAVSAFNGWDEGPMSAKSPPVTIVTGPRDIITTHAGAPGSGVPTSIGQDVFSIGADDGGVVFGDMANPVIRRLDSPAQESVVAGNDSFGDSGDGGPALAAALDGAGAMAKCGSVVYFADTYNYVIRAFYPGGTIAKIAGTGVPGYSGDGGDARQAQIGRVFGLACRSGGGIYISDSDNGAVRILANNVIHTWWYGLSFPTGIVELAGLNDVVAVSDDGGDNAVWLLTDSNAGVLAGTPGKAGNTGDGGPFDKSTLNDPQGLAQVGCCGQDFSLFIADRGNNRIREVDTSTGLIHAFAGSGTRGFQEGSGATAQFDAPAGLGLSGLSLYIADTGNHRVRVAVIGGLTTVSTAAGNGTLSLAGDGGPATAAQMGAPYAIAFDSQGNEYIADNVDNVIRKVDVDGTISTIAGNGTAGFSGDHVQATNSLLNDPRGVAVDAAGNIYISDTGNQRIRKVDVSGVITTVAGTGVAGYSGDNGAATSAKINYPRAVAVDEAGNVYIADSANHRVRRFTPGGTIVTVAGNGVGGFSGDGVATSVQLNLPRGLVIDASGNVFIGDSGNNRVRKLSGGMLTTVAGNGIAGVKGDGGPATSAELDAPFGVAIDGAGNLYIADTNNHRIRKVDPGGTITTVVGICGAQLGFRGDGRPAATAQLNFPFGLAADPAGDVYIADSNNNRVRTAFDLIAPSRQPGCPAPAQPHAYRFYGVNPAIATTASLKTADFGARIKYVEATRLTGHIAGTPARGSTAHRLDWSPARSAPKLGATPANGGAKPIESAPPPPRAPIAAARGAIATIAAHVSAPGTRPFYALAIVPFALLAAGILGWRRRGRTKA